MQRGHSSSSSITTATILIFSLPLPHHTFDRASTSFDSALSTLERPMIAQPIAPPPNATPGQVRRFLKEYFLSNRVELNENEAEEEATKLSIKLRVTGDGLYSLSKDTLIGTFGAEGELIYNILQSAKSGYEGGPWPVLKVVSKIFFLVAGCSAAFRYGKDSKDRNLVVTGVFGGLNTIILAFHRLCSSDRVLSSKFWPECFKIRSKSAAAVMPFVPW